jgi:thiamine-phosphate pyrophosphorylase
VRASGACYIVNDRADAALLTGADGVHVGQDDLAPEAARRLVGPERVVGCSTHNADQLADADAQPVDYVALGPIYPTHSKRNPDPRLGLGELERLRARTAKPLVAIGGLRRGTAAEAFAAGADSLAVISDLLDEPERSIREWLELTSPAPA